MPEAKERLGELLALAAEGRWTPLARQLADLVLDWPADWPDGMREPALSLLEWAARECDEPMHAELALRVTDRPDLPLKLVNELYLAAPAPLRREILMRNALERGEDETRDTPDAGALIAAARSDSVRDFAGVLCSSFAIPRRAAQAILRDDTGEALAVLCRGSGVDRATFSALALLRAARGIPLYVYDTVADNAARRLVRHWRTDHPGARHVEAA